MRGTQYLNFFAQHIEYAVWFLYANKEGLIQRKPKAVYAQPKPLFKAWCVSELEKIAIMFFRYLLHLN